MANKIPINVTANERETQRIEGEERSWSGPKLLVLCLLSIAASVAVIVFLAQCELTGLPH